MSEFPSPGGAKAILQEFLTAFRDPTAAKGKQFKYEVQLQAIRDRQSKVLQIDLDDLAAFSKDEDLLEHILENAQRYVKLFDELAEEMLRELEPSSAASKEHDVFDELQRQRERQLAAVLNKEAEDDLDPDEAFAAAAKKKAVSSAVPPALAKRHETRLLPPSALPAVPLRELKASDMGRLVRVRGIVTRMTDVKPLVEVVVYTCETCGYEIYHDVSAKRDFLPLSRCTSERCVKNQMVGRLYPQTRGSKFVKYQELRMQELPDQVPVGHIPRSITVQCRGELTRVCTPGDTVRVSAVFLPQRYEGFKAMKAGLISDTFLEASAVEKEKKSYTELSNAEADGDIEEKIDKVADLPDAYSRLARSIAPEIFGHEDVKKALLLQLVGGATRDLSDGVRIRGDINICMMGDPGVAKSQMLKYISATSPRGVYTTGKGSSGVGLTAAVVRDAVTSEMSLEGGALVLADCGICCIDEFDKMDDYDRTAIHEVMEQQTVSIAKAGITTTLNARCAVLAAANPLYGRYNKRKTLAENMNLPNSLLSRFDLIFLMLDKPTLEADMALARHITHVHRFLVNPDLDFTPYDATFLRHYISAARNFSPFVPPELTGIIVDDYVQRRQDTANDGQGVMTARQLLSILRISQALARLRFDDIVNHDDVEEATRLTHMSKASLDADDDVGVAPIDAKSKAFNLLRDAANKNNTSVLNYANMLEMATKRGIGQAVFEAMLADYQELAILDVNPERTRITFCE